MAHRYFVLHKPAGIVSQFVSPDRVGLLGHLGFDFPEGTHAVGRLDKESEGLLLLTTNKAITRLLFESAVPHSRSYLVRVKAIVTPETLSRLESGVDIRVSETEFYTTRPCRAELVTKPNAYVPSLIDAPYRGPYSWLLLTLTEGRYHQVRKMVGALRHRCQRLIRVAIEDLLLGDLPAGGVLELAEEEFFRRLRLQWD